MADYNANNRTTAMNGDIRESIDVIDSPTMGVFKSEYAEKGRPVLIMGLTRDWPAHATWNPEYLREKIGNRRVPIKTYSSAEGRYGFPTFRFTTFGDYLDLQEDPHQRRLCRLGDVNIEPFLSELSPDIRRPALVESSTCRAALFTGVDTFCNAHYHTADEALLTQVFGQKRILLFPPRYAQSLYPVPWYQLANNWSSVNVEMPDLDRHPRFKEAQPIEVLVSPGQSLYIPVHWFHAVFGVGMTATVTWFWPSNVRRWQFPFPGYRAFVSPVRYARFILPIARKTGQMDRLAALATRLSWQNRQAKNHAESRKTT